MSYRGTISDYAQYIITILDCTQYIITISECITMNYSSSPVVIRKGVKNTHKWWGSGLISLWGQEILTILIFHTFKRPNMIALKILRKATFCMAVCENKRWKAGCSKVG